MLDKLEAIKARFDQVGVALTNPEIINNQSEFGKMSKEYRSLEKIIIPYERYMKVLEEHKFAKETLNGDDAEMRELAKMEMPALDEEKDNLEKDKVVLGGEKLYQITCRVCHQQNGQGDGIRFPTIAKTDWVNGNKDTLIGVMLKGLEGPIKINGQPFHGATPEEEREIIARLRPDELRRSTEAIGFSGVSSIVIVTNDSSKESQFPSTL